MRPPVIPSIAPRIAVLFLAFSGAAAIALDGLTNLYSFFQDTKSLETIGTTPTIATFGYDAGRNGSVLTNVPADPSLEIESTKFPVGENKVNTISMPLYVNGFKDPVRGLEGARALIYGNWSGNANEPTRADGEIRAVDIDSHEVIWKTGIPGGLLMTSTPVLSVKREKIYFMARTWSPEKTNLRGLAPYAHWLYQVDTDGENIRRIPIDVDRLLRSRYPIRMSPSYRVRCDTALGLNEKISPSYVFWGCAVIVDSEAGTSIMSDRGSRGLLIAANLSENGDLMKGPDAIRAFVTSEMTADRMTGFSTGIDNTGSGPTLLPDGSLLASTGTGPFLPREGNFGCSVVRLDGKTLRPISWLGTDREPFDECLTADEQLSSASTLALPGGTLSADLTGNGVLRIFDPAEMPKTRFSSRVFSSYPSPLEPVVAQGNPRMREQARLWIVGKIGDPDRRDDRFMISHDLIDRLPGTEGRRCAGFLHRDPPKGAKGAEPLVLMYSGERRDDYAVAVRGSRLQRELTSPYSPLLGNHDDPLFAENLWSPYVEVETLGWPFSPKERIPEGYVRKKLRIRRQSLDIYATSADDVDHDLALGEEFDIIVPKDSPKDPEDACIENLALDLVPVYMIARDAPASEDPPGVYARELRVGSDGYISEKWKGRVSTGAPTTAQLARCQPIAAVNARTGDSSLIFVTQPDRENVTDSRLFVLDGDSGRILTSLDFQGQIGRTMPVAVDDRLFLATEDNRGIYEFRFRLNVWKYLWYHSRLLGLMR